MNVTAKYSNGAVHLGGHEFNGRWSPACGIQHHNGGGRTPNPLYPTDKDVTCKRCLKVIAKREAEQPEQAPEIKPGRCLSRIAEPGKNFFQCVREHGHSGDHAMMTPDASPTAQALAETSAARDDAMKAAYEAEGTEGQAYADVKYAIADAAYEAAKKLHRAARRAAGDSVKAEPFTFSYDATEGVLIAGALRDKADAERELSKELRVSHGGVGAAQADNRAGLLRLAADRIHKPVHEALVRDFDKALTKAEAQAETKPSRAARRIQDAIGLRW